jgi:hypothetical protein
LTRCYSHVYGFLLFDMARINMNDNPCHRRNPCTGVRFRLRLAGALVNLLMAVKVNENLSKEDQLLALGPTLRGKCSGRE